MKKSGKKVITLSKPYLIEGVLYEKNTKFIVESDDVYTEVIPPGVGDTPEFDEDYDTASALRKIRRARKLRRMEDEALEEEDGEEDSLEEEDEIEAEIDAMRKKISRLRKMQAMKKMKEEDGEDKELDEEEDEEADLMRKLRRVRRMKAMKKMDLEFDEGTAAGDVAGFESEIAAQAGVAAMRKKMAKARFMKKMAEEDGDDAEDKKEEDKKEE